jgi:tetratricopeptide (TPR) repeat protein
MDKASKLYVKALNEYHRGNIERALILCEKSISLNLQNPGALNLKGLLLYLKGDLEGAKALWKLNKDINKDAVAKEYLTDVAEDEKRRELYEAALEQLKEVRVKEAVKLLEKCEESDFNVINVANAITACFLRQGRYEEAWSYVDKVMAIDASNKEALKNKKLLLEYGSVKEGGKYKKLAIYAAVLALVTLSIYVVVGRVRHVGNRADMNSKKITERSENAPEGVVEEDTNGDKREEKNMEGGTIKENFPYESVKKAIEDSDYNSILSFVTYWQNKKISINEKALLNRGEEILKTEGTNFFYNSGRKSLEAEDYARAREDLQKAYSIGESNYLYSHIVFMLGYACERSGDIESSLKYYELYARDFSEGAYIEAVLYNLVMLYRNIDLVKAKEYGNLIISKYPNSIYNNSNVKEVMGR